MSNRNIPIENIEPHSPIDTSTETEQAILIELAALPPLEYDRVRIAKAKELKIRPTTLDNIVKINRTTQKKESKTAFPTVKPWHEPVDPAMLLAEIASTIQRFIICQPETIHAATLWIAMTWFIEAI